MEIHNVTTKDGYILELHRIPPKVASDGRQPKVVYLQPGLLTSSGYGLIKGKGSNRTINGYLGITRSAYVHRIFSINWMY